METICGKKYPQAGEIIEYNGKNIILNNGL